MPHSFIMGLNFRWFFGLGEHCVSGLVEHYISGFVEHFESTTVLMAYTCRFDWIHFDNLQNFQLVSVHHAEMNLN